ncbi:hypothetical protein N658DRAFT_478118 [Parathielavia hyrcaniae]|uniref:Uncharacterized protein n=1 Tax=Parathielavia hyrcaniae TaxID=113614 RepID=A0AAN6SYP0_9PEZI|nr:hypothetical protein N658DRAFT_478118 [Parathielavia hyrcaniae]
MPLNITPHSSNLCTKLNTHHHGTPRCLRPTHLPQHHSSQPERHRTLCPKAAHPHHHLDPSLLAPPYHDGTVPPHDFRDFHALPVFRHLLAQVLSQFYAAAVPNLEFEVQTHSTDPFRMVATWDGDGVFNKVNGFDLEVGYWVNHNGKECHGTIHAFDDVFDRFITYQGYVLYLVCGTGEAKEWKEVQPRVVRLDVVEQHDGGDAGRD